ncbi:Phospholipase D [Strongyloides ratti]|uniref:Phospholipase n=1 Tax=Strongyloides ratti TaxID=34506 RepID=A0A090KWW3_STRRB|nr:Phospholipase D [Strongyloides ratti]CEF60362.1 Phospholipase D [Strongyloides ratti]
MVTDELGPVADDSLFELCDCLLHCNNSFLKQRNLKGYIPYASVYDSLEEVRKRGYFIPGKPVVAKIIDVSKDEQSHVHVINAFLYTIQLTHGKYVWTVTKRFSDFLNLHRRLMAHRAVEKVKQPIFSKSSKFEDVLKIVAANNYHRHDCPLYRLFDEQTNNIQTLSYTNDNITDKPKKKVDIEGDIKTPTLATPENLDSPEIAKILVNSNFSLPKMPKIPEIALSEESVEERRIQLEKWIQAVLATPINRNYHETAEFLEVSRYSFINQMGKYKEGEMRKRPGGARVFLGWKQTCVRYFLRWSHRWLILKDTYVCYMHPGSSKIRLVLLIDNSFSINCPYLEIAYKPKDLVISNKQHILHMKCSSVDEVEYWKSEIRKIMENSGKIWLERHPHQSSYPIRNDCYSKWFVDGKEYWEYAADMIELAQEEIFIADWWLCPHIYMKRPMNEGNKWRLDILLKRKAEQGVKIFILIYKEMEMALNLNSLWMKKTMQALHPNIMVMRHPDHYPGTGTFFWAHHEKLLVIDQIIAFVGGLDLCYGRWDDNVHRLTDLGSIQMPTYGTINSNIDCNLISGMRQVAGLSASLCPSGKTCEKNEDFVDENTNQIESEDDVKDDDNDNIKKDGKSKLLHKKSSRMAAIVTKFKPSRKNKKRHSFPGKPQVNSHVDVKMNDASGKQELSVTIKDEGKYKIEIDYDNKNRKSKSFSRSRSKSPMENDDSRDIQKFDGKEDDEQRTLTGEKKVWGKVTRNIKDQTRSKVGKIVSHWGTNKMKNRWRDVLNEDSTLGQYELNWIKLKSSNEENNRNLQGGGKLWPGKDYVNYNKKDFIEVEEPFKDFVDRRKVPRMPWHDIHSVTFGTAARDVARHFIQRWNATKTEKLKDEKKYPYILPKSYDSVRIPRIFLPISIPTSVQVLRSAATWSALVSETEESIQNAYIELINTAKHYIYIENQFFVSMVNSTDVLNKICKALVDRITLAHENKETFRVYILIPLLPGFEGELSSNASPTSLHTVLHWTMVSIDNSEMSLYHCLRNRAINPDDYISFCSLRTHSVLWGKMISELVYIHCKCMIIDDEKVIIGSANINDRSQVGNRDSEVCLLIIDNEYSDGKMNGLEHKSGLFAKSLRVQLMREHLGLLKDSPSKTSLSIDLDDPTSDKFWNQWNDIAKSNTEIYEKVFRCFPTNKAETIEELDKWNMQMPLAELDPKEASELLKKLSGNLVIFPRKFLRRQNLQPAITSKEGLVPSSVFT